MTEEPTLAEHRPVSRVRISLFATRRAGIALALLLVAGCGDSINIPDNLRTPTVAGVVEESTQLPNGHTWAYRLADGQTLEIDYDQTASLLGGPQDGRLLLAGTDPDGRKWVAGIVGDQPARPAGCFLTRGQGRANDGWIETESGWRFPKAANFVDARDQPTDEFFSERGVFCLNDKGEVTSYDIG